MNYAQNLVRDLINQLKGYDLSELPNFKLRVQIKNALVESGVPLEQAQMLAMGMEVEVSEGAYQEVGPDLMNEMVEVLVNLTVKLNNAAIANGLGPITSANGLSLKLSC